MLRLMDIQRVREREPAYVYLVTLDRDGKVTEYEFTWEPPATPESPDHVHEPMEVIRDLVDYDLPASPGQPCGAFLIPPLNDILNAVSRVAHGKSLDFPIVLDER